MININTFKLRISIVITVMLITNSLYADNRTSTTTKGSHSESKQYYAPAKSLSGDWSLTDLQLDEDRPKSILKTRIIHNPREKTAKSNILIIESDTLGKTISGELFEIVRFPDNDHKNDYIKISFKTSKGQYHAKLSYHPISFDERVESWGGELYLDKKIIAAVVLEKDGGNTKHPYQGEYSYEESLAIKQEEKRNIATSIGKLQGNWRLSTDGQLLLKTQIIHNKGEKKGVGDYAIHEENYLGKAKHSSLIIVSQHGKKLNIKFNTSKGDYVANLIKGGQETPSIGYSEVWIGTITFPNNKEYVALFGKVDDVIEATVKKKPKSNLYNLNDTNNKFIFTCEKTACRYDYVTKDFSLKSIPLLKNWAITEPLYYATAGSGASDLPIIDFVNVKNGLWMSLNPRMADPAIVDCIEFGKNGRLSDEERVCYVKEELKENTGSSDMITLLENIGFWREKFYEQH